MHNPIFRSQHRRAFVGALALLLPLQILGSGAQQAPRSPESTTFVSPATRAVAVLPKDPAALPAGAEQIVPLTLEVVTRHIPLKGASRVLRQSVSRTRDRIHVAAIGGREWLFVRNPVDPRRVSGMLIDHDSRTIVVHEESDLRSRLGIDGWAEALLLGLDPEAVRGLQAAPQTRTIAGARFTRHSAAQGASTVGDVWWNDDLLLPGAFEFKDPFGTTRVTIERIVRGVKDGNLEMPASRFPSYKVMDLAESLEVR
jgi:hypothetical protein